MREAILINTSTLLEQRPAQLAMVGLIVARWAYVEQAMAFFYDYLLAQKGPPQEFGYPIDGLGVASFAAVRSLRAKLDLLHLAIEWRLGGEVLAEFKDSAGRRIETASRARNVVAHGYARCSDEYPDALVYDWNGRDNVYTTAALADVLEKVGDAHEVVAWFHNIRARSLIQSAGGAK